MQSRRSRALGSGQVLLLIAALLGLSSGLGALAQSPRSANLPTLGESDAAGAPDGGTAAPTALLASETVVTATRLPRPVREVPGTVVVLPRDEIDRNPSLTSDDLVRSVPSVATFRRSTSLAADPTSQGLNLRGVGPSGVSRGLVLLDGIPVNDAFGGWVYWRSLPRLGIERIEVSPSGWSALYGNFAMGGVLQLVSRRVDGSRLDADAVAGSYGTAQIAGRLTHSLGGVGAALEGEYLRSDGYPVVVPSQRGPVDRRTPSNHLNLIGQMQWDRTLHATASYFQQDQNGGTALTTSQVRVGGLNLATHWEWTRAGTVEVQLYGHVSEFDQSRPRVATDRSSETLQQQQVVPSDDEALTAIWTSPAREQPWLHHWIAGMEIRRVSGEAREQLYPAGGGDPTLRRSGGNQLSTGVFLENLSEIRRHLEVLAALRWDGWLNRSGHQTVEPPASVGQSSAFASRTEGQVSPRLGARWRLSDLVTTRAAAYRGFRAPTLNELYRPFQVGQSVTAANADLRSETLRGTEVGIEFAFPKAVCQLTGFWNDLLGAISNVTLASRLPDGSTRQRQNVGRARIRGTELSANWRMTRSLGALAAYTWVDATVTENAPNPALVGKKLPQDPPHRVSLQLTWSDPRVFQAAVQLRVLGPQYEDDLNRSRMSGALWVDVSASRRLFSDLEVFAAVENLFDRQYIVGRAGPDTIGQPLTIWGGLRIRQRP